MDRSDSLLCAPGEVFLSLCLLSRLAPAVGASGGGRASQFPYGSLLACHALRPRQVSGNLTCSGFLRVGFRRCDDVPSCMSLCRFEAGLLERGATPACGLRVSLCTLPGSRLAFGVLSGRLGLSFCPATLGLGW